jgi:epoxyqueuosine reductase
VTADLRERAIAAGMAAGLDAIGVASAEPFPDVRAILEDRRSSGLHGGMAFTYRNPARSTDPARSLPGSQALVVGALGYRRSTDDDHGTGTGIRASVARYSWEDFYAPLRRALGDVAEVLRDDGWQARVLVDDNALVDRAAAHRAGLGWFGKNANLLLPGLGSWFVLGSVVTDAPLRPTAEKALTTDDGCGSCTRCLPACPTGALVEPGVLDARRCLAWLLEAPGSFPREHRVALGDRIYGCDDCQEVCPPNRLDERRRPAAPAAADAEPSVDVVALLRMDDDALLDAHGRWYVPKRDPAYLRRNALVVLGNVGDPDDPDVGVSLRAALEDEREIVRAHAVWAARRLGLDALLEAVRDDPSPMVRDELGDAVPARTA